MLNKQVVFRPYNLSSPENMITSFTIANVQFIDDDFEKDIDFWRPGISLNWNARVELDSSEIIQQCSLLKSDKCKILISIISRGTGRTFGIIKDIDIFSNEKIFKLDGKIPDEEVSENLQIKIQIVVDPDLTIERPHGSPITQNTIILTKEYLLVLEKSSAYMNVIDEDLGEALWKFQFALPSDPSSWQLLEWNNVVQITTNSNIQEVISSSIELQSALFSELIINLLDYIISIDAGLETIVNTFESGTFISEVRRFSASLLQLDEDRVDLILRDWQTLKLEAILTAQSIVHSGLTKVVSHE
jgi:hypothetical protein